MGVVRPSRVHVAIVIGACLLIHGVIVLQYLPQLGRGELLDRTDSYIRLLRAERLYDSWSWYDAGLPRSTSPFGGPSHWTRPVDAMLLASAMPLAPLLGIRSALYWTAIGLGPVLQILIGLGVAWAALPLVPRPALVMLAVAAQPMLVSLTAGQIDHHALILVLFAAASGLVIRLLRAADDARCATALGACCALGLWVSIEFLLVLGVILLVTTAAWIWRGDEHHVANRRFAAAMLAGTAVALLLERPVADLFLVEYDRLSILHLWMLTMACLFWWLAPSARSTRPVGRLLVAMAGASTAAVGLWWTFPLAFAGPLAEVDPRLLRLWEVHVVENRFLWSASTDGPGRFVGYLGLPMAALGYAIMRMSALRDRAVRFGWLYLTLALLLYVPLAVARIRFAGYAEMLAAVAAADAITRLYPYLGRSVRPSIRAVVRGAGMAAVLVGAPAVGLAMTALAGRDGALPSRADACSVVELARRLEGPPFGSRTMTVAAHVDFGPQLLYRTHHRVLATPYHRNAEGILGVHDLLAGPATDRPPPFVQARGIDLVAICPPADSSFFEREAASDSLYERLQAGAPPAWLQPVRVTGDGTASFRVFEVPR